MTDQTNTAAPTDPQYDAEQRALGSALSGRLMTAVEPARKRLNDQTITTALFGAGVAYALKYLPASAVARWLREVADEIDKDGPPLGCAGSA